MGDVMIWAGIAICTAAIALCIWNHYQTRKTMDILNQMLDEAISGDFQESHYDETRLSALENKLARYLSSSALSAKKVTEEKNKIKTLIADISHQTKTPISNLLLYSELLQEKDLDNYAAANAKIIHEQAAKLKFLIDALVKLSRLENGILVLSPVHNEIQPILQKIEESYRVRAEEKGLVFSVERTNCAAWFDAKWTLEALENIVDNAIKYTDAGSVFIRVQPYELFTRIEIADTGSGIPESEQAKIFSRFYRSATVRKKEGLGIGLHLSREILAAEGGYIKVSSNAETGSVFSVFIPNEQTNLSKL